MKFDFKKLFVKEYPRKKAKKSSTNAYERAFRAAMNSRFVDWLFTSNTKINNDLVSQLKTLITRSRDLSINNQMFRSYLSNCEKSIVGSQGFRLQMQIKNADGSLNKELNDQIEWAWYEFTKKGNLQLSEQLNDIDFDTLVLRTLLVDGEVFIQKIDDPESPFGIRFKLIDSLAVDCNKIQIMTETQNGIYNGVEVDHNYRPVRYWLRECYNGNYDSGRLYSVPADKIIHLYRQEFIDQVRGYSPIVASLGSLKQLDDFAVAELIAAKIASCQGVFYERTGGVNGDFMSQEEADEVGTFLQQLSPGVASIVPKGYSIKQFNPNHPSSQYGVFTKAISKRVAASIGSNYNKLNQDYESVNYSSLRQAAIDQNSFFKSWQRFCIENWKNVQFELFLKGYLINSKTELKPSLFSKYIRSYRFIPKTDIYYDRAKQIIAIQRELSLGLTSPIIQIEKKGLDYQEVLNDWVKFNDACKEKGLYFKKDQPLPVDAVDQYNDEANNGSDLDNNQENQ